MANIWDSKAISVTTDPTRYGNRKISKMMAQWRKLAELCRSEGSPAIQDALDDCETWIDFAFGQQKEESDVT